MSNQQNNQYYESASVGTQLADSFQNSTFVKYFASPQGLTIVALLVFLGMGSLMQGGRGTKVTKGKLANGRFGGSKELSQAKKVALNQLQVRQKQPVAVWIGEPTTNPFSKPPIYLPEANRSTLVMGAAAAGKTVSAINQIAISAIDQGFPVVEFDFKYPDQTSILASYAKAKGYEIHVFAPGYPESGRLNPITEFLDNELSGLYASQLAEVMNANFIAIFNWMEHNNSSE